MWCQRSPHGSAAEFQAKGPEAPSWKGLRLSSLCYEKPGSFRAATVTARIYQMLYRLVQVVELVYQCVGLPPSLNRLGRADSRCSAGPPTNKRSARSAFQMIRKEGPNVRSRRTSCSRSMRLGRAFKSPCEVNDLLPKSRAEPQSRRRRTQTTRLWQLPFATLVAWPP